MIGPGLTKCLNQLRCSLDETEQRIAPVLDENATMKARIGALEDQVATLESQLAACRQAMSDTGVVSR